MTAGTDNTNNTPLNPNDTDSGWNWRDFPWWLVSILALVGLMGFLIFAAPPVDPEDPSKLLDNEFNEAFNFIRGGMGDVEALAEGDIIGFVGKGVTVTIFTTLVAFIIAMIIGLFAGLGRMSKNVFVKNLATLYVEFIRGVPTLVLIFTLAFVVVPEIINLVGLEGSKISLHWRAIAALAIIYGAFLAEVFRAGIESIPVGQVEAAKAVGMNGAQTMRFIILPQAIRNILPALGNDFIAMLKDSSLVSVLAVRDITQQARLYAGSSFRFRETYLVLTFLYLSMTLVLSLILRWYERRIRVSSR
ncbi:MAG: amino acid ABC transporter permease [Chloroflexota bacterium]